MIDSASSSAVPNPGILYLVSSGPRDIPSEYFPSSGPLNAVFLSSSSHQVPILGLGAVDSFLPGKTVIHLGSVPGKT